MFEQVYALMATWPGVMASQMTREGRPSPTWRVQINVFDGGAVTVTTLGDFALTVAQRSEVEALLHAQSAARFR